MPHLSPELNIDAKACLRCAACVSLCPTDALTLGFEGIVCQAEQCTLCLDCVLFCPVEAIKEPHVS